MKKNLNNIPNVSNSTRNIIDDVCLRGRKIIWVEGIDNSNDKKVYEKVACENVIISTHYSGKKEDIIKSCREDNRPYAIVDKDYDIPDDKLENVFYTDYNDIESTAVNITNDSNTMYESLHIKFPNKEVFERKIYRKALELSKQISNINKYIHDYNNECNTRYKYLIRKYIGYEQKNIKNIGNIRNIDFISNNDNLKIDVIINLYKDEIDFNEDFLKELINKDTNSFRGHDLFIILDYLIEKYKVEFEEEKFNRYDFANQSYGYLEEKYIDIFARNRKIKESKLYRSIIDSKQGLFKEYE